MLQDIKQNMVVCGIKKNEIHKLQESIKGEIWEDIKQNVAVYGIKKK